MFKLQFETENAAFDDDARGTYEVARILEKLASDIRDSRRGSGTLYDQNGNLVGSWSWAQEDSE